MRISKLNHFPLKASAFTKHPSSRLSYKFRSGRWRWHGFVWPMSSIIYFFNQAKPKPSVLYSYLKESQVHLERTTARRSFVSKMGHCFTVCRPNAVMFCYAKARAEGTRRRTRSLLEGKGPDLRPWSSLISWPAEPSWQKGLLSSKKKLKETPVLIITVNSPIWCRGRHRFHIKFPIKKMAEGQWCVRPNDVFNVIAIQVSTL